MICEYLSGTAFNLFCPAKADEGLSIEDWRNIILIAAACIGLPLAIWRSWVAHKQAKVSETGLNIDRYQRAVQLLGDDNLTLRLSAIFMLHDFGQTTENNAHTASHTLSHFINAQTATAFKIGMEPDLIRRAVDIKQAFANLGHIKRGVSAAYDTIEITGAHLSFMNLTDFDCLFDNIAFFGCTFDHCKFTSTTFSDVLFKDCSFKSTKWTGCKLESCIFNECRFHGSDILDNEMATRDMFMACEGLPALYA